jgi:hypothetical protein
MTKKSFILRNVVAITICLAVSSMFLSCDDKPNGNGGNNGGNITAVAITLDLMKGNNDNEIIVKCTPKCPWLAMGEGMWFGPCYFNQEGSFYLATKTGGTATQIFTSPNDDPGWNKAGTEYTYYFGCFGDNWEGTIILAPVDQERLKTLNIETMGVKSITIGKNDPVPLKLGY